MEFLFTKNRDLSAFILHSKRSVLRGFTRFSYLVPSLLLSKLPFWPIFLCHTAHISRASVAIVPIKATFLQKYSPETRNNAQGRRTKHEETRAKEQETSTQDQGPRYMVHVRKSTDTGRWRPRTKGSVALFLSSGPFFLQE